MKILKNKKATNVVFSLMIIPSTLMVDIPKNIVTKQYKYVNSSHCSSENFQKYTFERKKTVSMLEVLSNSSEFTEGELEDYQKGSSKFYSAGATILFNLEDIYGEF